MHPSDPTTNPSERITPLAWLVLALGLLATAWLLYRTLALPPVVPAQAAATYFSAARAVEHLPTLTAAPRPAGAAAHARSRAYLVAELRALGLEPEVQRTTSLLRFPGAPGFSAGYVQNVVVRLPGSDPTGAIAIDAHYDGATNGPAAADCGACVVTALESVRALLAGPPLRNDLIFVFADAEEVGDLGANAFVRQHPWMADVRLAINYEAMGTAGPAYLYATNADNYALMRAYARAAPGSPTNSFTVGIFNLLPEQRLACDLQDYLDAGRPGYGFVFTGKISPYHTRLDDPDHLSPATVQQLGNTTLALLRYWGRADLERIGTRRDAVFFPLAPGRLVVYPATWSLPLALGGTLLLLLVLAWQVRRGRLRIKTTLLAALGTALAGLLTVAASVLLWYGIKQSSPPLRDFLVGHWAVYDYLAGLQLFAVAGVLTWVVGTRRWFSAATQLGAVLLLYGVGALWLGRVYPVGSYVFGWPLWVGSVVLFVLSSDRPPLRRPRVRAGATLALAAAVAILTVPLLIASNPLQALLIRLDATAGIPALGLAPFPAVWAVLLLAPLGRLFLADRRLPVHRWAWVGVPLLLSVGLFGWAWWGTGYTEQRPRPESIRYERDADRGTARWVSGDAALGAWTGAFIPTAAADSARSLLRGWPATFSAAAPDVALESPAIESVRDTSLRGSRVLELWLRSGWPGSTLLVTVQASEAIDSAWIDGFSFPLREYAPARSGELRFNYAATPPGGVVLSFASAPGDPVAVEVVELRNGLPEVGQPPRPATTMASPLGADATVVRIRRRF